LQKGASTNGALLITCLQLAPAWIGVVSVYAAIEEPYINIHGTYGGNVIILLG
jgi:hypothetical protein